jgi:hypothetical protein
MGRPRLLNYSEEEAICAYIIFCSHGRFPMLQEMIIAAAQRLPALRNAPPAKLDNRWLRRFIQNHPQLDSTTYNAVDIKRRFFKLNHESVNEWFDEFEEKLARHKVQARDIWNADETGCQIGVLKSGQVKVVVLKELKRRKVCTIPSFGFQARFIIV